MGVITESLTSVFQKKDVDSFFERNRFEIQKTPKFIFMGIDPNGGGSSCMAIVSCIMEYGQVVLIGVEVHPCKNAEAMRKLLIAHVEYLRSFPVLNDAYIIGVFESNLGHESSHLEYFLKEYKKIYVINEKGKTGVHTTAQRKGKLRICECKIDYTLTLYTELYAMETTRYFAQKSIHIWKHFRSSNPNSDSASETSRVLKEFEKQLFMFKRILVRPMRGFTLPRVVYTGKMKGANDDIVITLTMLLYWASEFICQRTSAPMEILDA